MDKKPKPTTRSTVKSSQAKVDPAKVPKKKAAVAKSGPTAGPSKPPSRPSSGRPSSSTRPKSGSRPASTKSKPASAPRPKPRPKRPLPKKDEKKIAELTEAALRGRHNLEYPHSARIVRIFTSSTFTDTKVERNTLMEKVYPKLKMYCQEQGYEFQVVDMRWGVRDEATEDHMTSELCMREIKDCETYSTGPSFITFLSQKYGYRPFPPRIDAAEFEKLLKSVQKADDKKLLADWFLKDDNCVPAQYQLQPIREKLPDYANDAQLEKKKQARDKWWEVFEKMQLVLREAASKSLKKEDAHKYFWSVTEEEIENGILNHANAKQGCFWFRRDITDLRDNVKSKMARRFMDVTWDTIDKEALDLLTRLKENKVPTRLPKENVIKYEVKWTQNGIDTELSEEHKKYIDTFSEDFERVLQDMIEQGIHERYRTEVDDPLYQECVLHVMFGQSKAKLFHGRQEFMDRIKESLIKGNHGAPLVIYGEAGSGKTTAMAKVFQMITNWMGESDMPVVVRFVGTTAGSATTRDLLTSLCQQIHKLTEQSGEIPDDIVPLRAYFKELVQNLRDPTCIVLDSLDQLRDAGRGLREWVPCTLPDGIRLIMSTIPGEEFHVMPELKKFLPSASFVKIPELDQHDVETIVRELLQQAKRGLQPAQSDILVAACRKCPLPLYARIAIDESCRWKSHSTVAAGTLGATVTVLINSVFEKVEKYHGKVLVSHALGYITAARAGLSLSEIEDILSLDDVALDDIYQYHMPPLRRLPPLLWVRIQADLKDYLVNTGSGGVQVIRWYHRQFHTVATERYLADSKTRSSRHVTLVEFFQGRWSTGEQKGYTDKKGNLSEADRYVAAQPLVFKEASSDYEKTQFNLRKMHELCYHLIKSKQVDLAKKLCLCHFEWIYEKIRAVGITAVLEDYDFIHEAGIVDTESSTVEMILELSKNGIAHDPKLLACHLLGRLYNVPDWAGLPHIKRLVEQANTPHFDCLVPTLGFLETSGGAYIGKFVGHQGQVTSYGVNADGSKLVSGSMMMNTLIVWDMETTQALKTFPLPMGVQFSPGMSSLEFCNKDRYVAAVAGNISLYVLDLESGELVHNIPVPTKKTFRGVCYVNQTRNLAYGCTDSDVIAHDVKSGNQIFKIERNVAAVENPIQSRLSYVGGLGSHVAYHFAGDNKVHFINDVDYPKKKKVVTVEIFSTSSIKPELSVFSGRFAEMKTFDVKTGKHLKTLPRLPTGMMYWQDNLMATSPNTVVYLAYLAGPFSFKEYDVETGNSRDTLIVETSRMEFAAPGGKNRVLFTTIGDANNIQMADISKCRQATDSSMEELIKRPRKLGLDIHGPLLDSKRYITYTTISGGLGVWDVAKNVCVRLGNHAIQGSCDHPKTAKWISPTRVVMARQGKVISYYDYKENKLLQLVKKHIAETSEEQLLSFLTVPGTEMIMIVGPQPNEISTYDLKKGAVVSKITGPKEKKYGGLLASENFDILLVLDTFDNAKDMPKGRLAMKKYILSVYDLKTKKPLGPIEYEAMMPLTPGTLTSCFVVALSKNGKYFGMVSLTLEGVARVWDIHTGEVRTYGLGDPSCVVRFLEGEVLVGHKSGTVGVYDLKSTKRTKSMETKLEDVSYITMSPDGKLLACMSNARTAMELIDVRLGQTLMTFSVGKQIRDSVFSTNGQFLLLAVQAVDGLLPLYIYSQTKHRGEGRGGNSTPEANARKELLSDPDVFGKPMDLEAKDLHLEAKKGTGAEGKKKAK